MSLMKLSEVALDLKVCLNTVKAYIREDRLQVVGFSERVNRIDPEELKAFKERNKKWQSQKGGKSITPDSRSVTQKSASRLSARDMMTRKSTSAN